VGQTRRTFTFALGTAAIFAPHVARTQSLGDIDLNAAPYWCGAGQSSDANRDAIAQALDDLPPAGRVSWAGPITVAPGPQAYIQTTKGMTFEGRSGWHSAIIPDPEIPSDKPIIWAIGVRQPENFFQIRLRHFQVGRPRKPDFREGGTGIRIDANSSGAGTEGSGIENVYIHGGPPDRGPYGVQLIHSTDDDAGPIYNFTIDQCTIMGGLRAVRIADSVRITRSLFWGSNDIEIDCRPTEGKFIFDQNNVTTAGGLRMRAGNAPSITRNIFSQQVHSAAPNNALIDLTGDLGEVRSVDLSGNRIHKEKMSEARPISARLLRCDNVSSIMMSHNDFSNYVGDTPIEFTANCRGVALGFNTWQLPDGVPRFINRNQNEAVHEIPTFRPFSGGR
jgi:hypothetical protein